MKRDWFPPVLFSLILILAWEALTILMRIPRFLLPSPLDVCYAAAEHSGPLSRAALLTAMGALGGFSLSIALGLPTAFLFSQSAAIRRSLYPYAILLQTVPIVAIAPLIIIWFGTGFMSVIIVSFIISLFPIITNTTTGLLDVDHELLELFALYGAKRRHILLKLRLPNAIPYLFAGARISSGLAVIGAIVGEFFAGYGAREYGLGYLIIVSSGQLKTPLLFAAIIASSLLGLVFFALISRAGDHILARWMRNRS